MPDIKYIDLFEIIRKQRYEAVCLSCCDPGIDAFSLLRVQMQGDIYYTRSSVYIAEETHDQKCEDLLRIANREGIDLLLFPEYCISTGLIRKIAADEGLWPDEMKLWCLPCQGIPKQCFTALIDQLRQKDRILLIDDAIGRGVNGKKFVNAMFYCFRVEKDDESFLCLAPQLKTQHMSDPNCECEAGGLTTGSRIFTLGKRLVTFLCADTLNNGISWQDLQREELTNGIIMLHPQMNRAPKHIDFSSKRREMWSHNHPGLCITCNWAAGTRLISANANPDQEPKEIELSWSCVYEKHTNFPFDKWQENTAAARKESAACDLFSAFMPTQKTEVWFSTSAEQATAMILPNQVTDQLAVTTIRSIKATDRFFWQDGHWESVQHLATLEERMEPAEVKEKLGAAANVKSQLEPCYYFPFTEPNKYLVDHFFSITLPDAEKALLTIDKDENLADWGILLEEDHFRTARRAFQSLHNLTQKALTGNDIPRRLYGLKGEHRFFCKETEHGLSWFNMDSVAGKLLIVYAEDDIAAKKLSKILLKTVFNQDENRAQSRLGIIYPDFAGNGYHVLPEYTPDISQGDHLIREGDLTNGSD